ncbi:MAG: DUF4234 domain-containing protein [Ruminococcaceae bacterium]|nr:DUF4234 domain-containing protein [Oscillospiraceae bacterium]
MTAKINERSFISFLILSVITFGIYPIVYWHKISKDVEILCEGDGRKTMKYVFIWLLNFVTFGIAGIVWRAKLAQRLKENAARYDIKISESAALVVVYELLIILVGPFIARYVIVKNFNALAVAFNEYNGLTDADDDVFADAE